MKLKSALLTVLIVAAAAAALMFAAFTGALTKVFGGLRKPSVILITLDTTRADRLGCYGYDKPISPNIDQVAAEGVKFDLAVAQAAVTPVSHASILTGLFPFEHNVRVLHGASSYRLEPGIPTLASVLRSAGWRTGAFVSAFTVSEYFGLDHGFDTFETGLEGDVEDKMQLDEEGRASWTVHSDQRRADETTGDAIEWLRKDDEPFFLWLHFFDPHDPTILPPPEFLQRYCPPPASGLSQEDSARAVYDAEVAYMDSQLGRLFRYLEDSGRSDETIVVITNDHGEGLGDHDWWFHRILYQEQIRMPLVVRAPGVPRGRSVPDLVRSIDIMPTVLQLAGVEAPPMTGRSLVGLMHGEPEPPRVAYADALIRLDNNRPRRAEEEDQFKRYNDLMYCVISGPWKLIHFHFQPEQSELYWLEKDPAEARNVIDQYPEKRAELLRLLEPPGVMIEDLLPATQDSEAIRRLRTLGYGY